MTFKGTHKIGVSPRRFDAAFCTCQRWMLSGHRFNVLASPTHALPDRQTLLHPFQSACECLRLLGGAIVGYLIRRLHQVVVVFGSVYFRLFHKVAVSALRIVHDDGFGSRGCSRSGFYRNRTGDRRRKILRSQAAQRNCALLPLVTNRDRFVSSLYNFNGGPSL